MNETVSKVVESMRGTPFVLALLIINVLTITGFSYTLHEISDAVARRDKILERCIK
jgi:hypothetical protein